MDVNSGGNLGGGPTGAVVELSAAEAVAGTAKSVPLPPDGTPTMIYFPPGAVDGSVLNVELPGIDPATGATVNRLVPVTIRVLPGGPFPPPPGPGQQFPGQPQPGFAPPPGYPHPGFAPPGFAAAPPPAKHKLSTGAKVTAGVLGAVLLGGVLLVPSLLDSDDPTTVDRTALGSTIAPTEEAAATVPPLDPKSFQFSLDEANRQLTTGLATLNKATTPAATAKAADELAETVGTQTATLGGLTAPPEVSAAHQELVYALSALEGELTSLAGSATSQDVCTGGAASAVLSRADAAADLRTAISGLASADPAAKYTFGSFLPAVTKDQNRRKANATYLKRVTGGSGELKVDNGNSGDVVIKLVKSGSKKPSVTVYIRGKKKVTTGRIKDGTYQVYVSSGTDWDGKRFTRDCGFSKFDSSFKFTTTSRQYTIWQLSLKSVLGGNATSTPVDPDAVPE